MSDGVLVTVIWKLKHGLTDRCIESLEAMFPTTRLKKGFRNIRLLRSASDPDELMLLQEWDQVQDHLDYMQFRTESGDMANLLSMTVGPPQLSYWGLGALASAQA